MSSTKPLILYHDDMDGFVAAFCFYLVTESEAEYRAVQYGQPAPDDVAGRSVAILDFSYDRDTIEAMWTATDQNLLVLDHHVSAAQSLQGLPYCHVDVTKSGALLAYRHVLPMLQTAIATSKTDLKQQHLFRLEALAQIVDDCDRYQHILPNSISVYLALHSYDQDFAFWRSNILERHVSDFHKEGAVLQRYQDSLVAKLVKNARPGRFGQYLATIVNIPYFQSEVGSKIATDDTIAVMWFHAPEGYYVYSLRSAPDGPDVSVIAQQHGGGGHVHAAGFTSTTLPCEMLEWES